MKPKARRNDLLVHELGDEIVVYDRAAHQAHRLNQTAAVIWRASDGTKTPAELAELAWPGRDPDTAECAARLALDRLAGARLLEQSCSPGISRREMVRRLRTAGMLSVLLPVVTSLAAPSAAQAVSPAPGGNCPATLARGRTDEIIGSGSTQAAAMADFNARVAALCDGDCLRAGTCPSPQQCRGAGQAVTCVEDPPGNWTCRKNVDTCACRCA